MNAFRDCERRSVGGETILLVEDEAFVLNVATAVLQSAGYTVLAVRNAAEARRIYEQRSGQVDLLLTDIVLPGEDGRRLAKRLSGMNPAMQVLLITGYSERIGAGERGEAGENLLLKPFSASTLGGRVRELLDRGQCSPLAEGYNQARLR